MTKRRYPTFLGIGAQKAGTTWLHAQLSRHPDVWLPPTKEIHYFDRRHRHLPGAIVRYDLDPVMMRAWMKHQRKRALRAMRHRHPGWHWLMKFQFGWRSDRWYASLFQPRPGQIAGEVTPDYAVIPSQRIHTIKRLMPDARLIYLMREPIRRQWSQAAMFLAAEEMNGRRSGPEALKAYLGRDDNLRQSLYHANLQRWREVFSDDQLYIGALEEIEKDPEQILRSILEFLGLDPGRFDWKAAATGERVNRREYSPVPDEMSRALAAKFLPDLERLHRELNRDFTRDWLENARAQAGAVGGG
jgi:hypothetical protein